MKFGFGGKMFLTNISKNQAKDSGMAMVLILLLLGFYFDTVIFFKFAIAALLIVMIFPMAYKYFAIIWLNGAKLLGDVVSKIILSVIFLIVVLPVGIIRRLLGKDILKLRQFKKESSSVMVLRNLT